MKLIIHIGQSKTGTSAIQAHLTLNRDSLMNAGVLYPIVKVGNLPVEVGSHNPVADSLVGLSRHPYLTSDEYFDLFLTEAQKQNSKMMILSGEHFFGGEPRVWDVPNEKAYYARYQEKIRALSKYVKGFEVSLILYLRPQVDWLASAISHTVRIERLVREQPIYFNDHQFFDMYKPGLRYFKLVEYWSTILNPHHITVVPYEKNNLVGKSSISDFLYRANLSDLHLPYSDNTLSVNTSISREFIEVKKVLNQVPRSKIDERVILACLKTLTEKNLKNSPYWISDKLIAEIMSFSREGNQKLTEKYLKDQTFLAISSQKKNYRSELLTEREINNAHIAFTHEYKKNKYRLLRVSLIIRLFLRDNVGPAHALLHQLKRLYVRVWYKLRA